MIKDDLQARDGFSSVESHLADYFLREGDAIRELSARAIARQLHAAPSSVVRFCQRLGFDGYQEFRDAWLTELRYLDQSFADIDANRPFDETDSPTSIAAKVGVLYRETISDTLELLDAAALRQASSALGSAASIVVMSLGVQADVAADFADKMLHLGRRVTVERGADSAYYLARTLTAGDVMVVISYSGETSGSLRAAAVARRRGATVVAITSFGRNRLSDIATVSLRVSTRERLVEKVGSYAMSLSTILVLDILYSQVFALDYAGNLAARTAAGQDYERHRDTSNPAIRDRWRIAAID